MEGAAARSDHRVYRAGTGNACSRAADHADFIALVAGIRSNQRISIVTLDSRLLDRGLERMASRADKTGRSRTRYPRCIDRRPRFRTGGFSGAAAMTPDRALMAALTLLSTRARTFSGKAAFVLTIGTG